MRRIATGCILLGALAAMGVVLGGCARDVGEPAAAYEPVPELFEREILPVTAAVPTAACIVPRYLPDSSPAITDHLVVGMADGRVASFHGAGGPMVGITSYMVSPGVAISDVAVYTDPRAGGLGTEHAVLALHGRVLTSLSLETMSPLGRLELPSPPREWSIRALRDSSRHDGSGTRAMACDGVTTYLVEGQAGGAGALGLRAVVSPGTPVEITDLSDGVAVASADSIWLVDGSGRVMAAALVNDGSLAASRGRCALTPAGNDSTLVLCTEVSERTWVRRAVALPRGITTAMVVSDSLVFVGGGRMQVPEHEIGWLALVNSRGRVTAVGDHPAPVALLSRVGGFLAAQGRERNLSVYDMRLNPIWDRASQVSAVALLPCHFNADDSADLAVVSSRLYSIGKSDGDMLAEAIGDWSFMDGAVLVPNVVAGREPSYESVLPHIAFFAGNETRLRRMAADLSDDARAASSRRNYADAVGLAVRARAAASVLGDIATARELTLLIADSQSMPRRINAALLAALLLGVAGLSALVLSRLGAVSHRFSLWSGVALLGAAAAATLILRAPPTGWTMFVGGSLGVGSALAGEAGRRYLLSVLGRRRSRGAPVEELALGIAEFKHGGAEGGSDEGRKSITRLAYLAQDMLESLDDPKRLEMLRERIAVRADAFLHSKYQLTRMLLSHAAEAGVARDEVGSMASAADQIREGLETVLAGGESSDRAQTSASREPLERALVAIQKGRDELVRAADRAWELVNENPGCSVNSAVRRMLDQKTEDLAAAGISARHESRVRPERDAVSISGSEMDFVLENLLSNAIRYMKERGEREIRIAVAATGPLCELRVSDTGRGIAGDRLKGLFDRKEGDGTGGGFGLPNSREKLRRRGGDIVVESTEVGAGTTFLVTIPFWVADRPGDDDGR